MCHHESRTWTASPGKSMAATAPAHEMFFASSLVGLLSGRRALPPPLPQADQLERAGGGRQRGTWDLIIMLERVVLGLIGHLLTSCGAGCNGICVRRARWRQVAKSFLTSSLGRLSFALHF